MARGPSNSPNRSSPAKKTPAKSKRPASTAPAKGTRKKTTARKAATTLKRAAAKATRKASKKAGKPKTASTAKHGGSSRPPARSPRTSTRRAASAQSAKDAAGGATDETPGAIGGRILVQNVNVPGYTTSVDAAKYRAMRDALLAVLPKEGGLTQAEMFDAVKPRLPPQHFPGGAKAEWWVKCVQLDLEAKGQVAREASKPLRWRRA